MYTTKRIQLDALIPDMIVAEPVTDRNGRLLVGNGVVISDDHVRNLRAWGISDVLIETPSATEPAASSVEVPEDMGERFLLNDVSQGSIPTLLEICQEHRAKGFDGAI